MRIKFILLLFAFCSIGAYCSAFCGKKKSHFKLITAYSKTITAEKQSNPPMSGDFFVIKWKSSTPPHTFFWRGSGGWLSCKIEIAENTGNGEYKGTLVSLRDVNKGDILLLTPLTGGRFPIPAEIPENAKNTLFYKVGNSNWLAFPVKNIK